MTVVARKPLELAGAPYALAIFDLDGTLADSFPWFQRVFNGVADRYGFRRVAEHEVAALRGKGPRELLAHLDVPVWKLPLIAAHMRRLKSRHLDDIPLFPGARADLVALSVDLRVVATWLGGAREDAGSDA